MFMVLNTSAYIGKGHILVIWHLEGCYTVIKVDMTRRVQTGKDQAGIGWRGMLETRLQTRLLEVIMVETTNVELQEQVIFMLINFQGVGHLSKNLKDAK